MGELRPRCVVLRRTPTRCRTSSAAAVNIGSPNAYCSTSSRASGGITVSAWRPRPRWRPSTASAGMCPCCEGRGRDDFDLTVLYDDSKSLNEGAPTTSGDSMEGCTGDIFRGAGGSTRQADLQLQTSASSTTCSTRDATRWKVDGIQIYLPGPNPQIEKSLGRKDVDAMEPDIRRLSSSGSVTFARCRPGPRRHAAEPRGAVCRRSWG